MKMRHTNNTDENQSSNSTTQAIITLKDVGVKNNELRIITKLLIQQPSHLELPQNIFLKSQLTNCNQNSKMGLKMLKTNA